MATEEQVLYIAIGCSVGGVVLIVAITVICCVCIRRKNKEKRKHHHDGGGKFPYHNAAFTSMPHFSSDPKGMLRAGSIDNLGPNRAYLYHDRNPDKRLVNGGGGFPLRAASSETQLYGGGYGVQRPADGRLQHYVQRNGGSMYQIDVEDRQRKYAREIRQDAQDYRQSANGKRLGREQSFTARIDIGVGADSEDDMHRGLTSTSKTKLVAVNNDNYVARAYSSSGNIAMINTAQPPPAAKVSRVPSLAPVPQRQVTRVSHSPSRADETGRYHHARPSYQHYDWRQSPYTSHQNVYSSNPNVYFYETPLLVQHRPWGFSASPGGNVVLSPAATFGSRPGSAREKEVTSRPQVQRSSSQNEPARGAVFVNGALDADRAKPEKKPSKSEEKRKRQKKGSDKNGNVAQVPVTRIDSPRKENGKSESVFVANADLEHVNGDGAIYAVPNKKLKKKSPSKKEDDGGVKLISKSFMESPQRTESNYANGGLNEITTKTSFTKMEVRADVEVVKNERIQDSAIYDSIHPEPLASSPGSAKSDDLLDGKHVTAAAFKFLDNYDDDHFSTGGRKSKNAELVPARSQMSPL